MKTQTTIRVDESSYNKAKEILKELESKNGKTFKNIDELFDDLDN